MITIRNANKIDSQTILDFIIKIAEYEKLAHEVTNTVEQIEERFFNEHPLVHALIVEKDGKPIGYAIYFFNYSTFTGKHGLYLEDFFVNEEYRHQGIGKQIFNQLISIANEQNCSRMEWVVLDWNQSAIDFYESYNGKAMKEWIIYRLNEQQLNNFK